MPQKPSLNLWYIDMSEALGTFPLRLQFILQKTGMAGSKLALMLDVSPATISGWLSGKKQPTLENLIRLSEMLNISLCWLVHNEGTRSLHGPLHLSKAEENMLLKLREFPQSVLDDLFTFISAATQSESVNGETLVEKANAWNLVEAAGIAILILDREYIIRDINQAYLGVLNLNENLYDEVLNTSFLSWIDPSDQAETLLNIVRAKSKQQIDNFYSRHLRFKTSCRARVLINAVYHQKDGAEYTVIYAFTLPDKTARGN